MLKHALKLNNKIQLKEKKVNLKVIIQWHTIITIIIILNMMKI